MARVVNFIVSCTNRKRFEGPPETAVHEIGGKDLPARLKIWKRNLRLAPGGEHRASDVYMGDHWSVVRNIPGEAGKSGLNVRVWICSAGYGLRQAPPSQFIFARMLSVFSAIFDLAQNAAIHRLHETQRTGKIKGFIFPYLGQQDRQLPNPPADLVRR